MSSKPELQMYESYLEKSKEFFSLAKSRAFEICAIATGTEEEERVTLTDLIMPEIERTLIVELEQFKEMKKEKQEYYELISAHDRSCLTSRYVEKIKGYIKGREHNHPGRTGRMMPTVGDVIEVSENLRLIDPMHSYFIEVIHNSKGFNIFYYRIDDLRYIHRKICTDGINQVSLENWLQKNKEGFCIKKFEIIKGK